MLYTAFKKYDVCYAFTVAQPQIAWPAIFCKKYKKMKLIIDWDDLWGDGFGLSHPWIVNRILSWHERWTLQFANSITFVSEFIFDEIKKSEKKYNQISFIDKYKIINGADADMIWKISKEEAREKINVVDRSTLVSMGNTYTDSLGIILRAIKILKERGVDFQLLMVGSAPIPKKFMNLYNDAKENIKYIGSVPHEMIRYYLGAADVLLLPMDDDPVEHARFPMRFGDYLLAGRPIASNAVGEVRKFIENYGVGIASDPNSEGELAEAIIFLLNNEEISLAMGRKAIILAENEMSHKMQCEKLSTLVGLI